MRLISQETERQRMSVDMNDSRTTEIRLAKTCGWIIGTYIVCWVCMTINYFVVGITEDDEYFLQSIPLFIFYVLAIWAAHVNSAINPFIYAYKIKDVRDALKELRTRIISSVRALSATSGNELN